MVPAVSVEPVVITTPISTPIGKVQSHAEIAVPKSNRNAPSTEINLKPAIVGVDGNSAHGCSGGHYGAQPEGTKIHFHHLDRFGRRRSSPVSNLRYNVLVRAHLFTTLILSPISALASYGPAIDLGSLAGTEVRESSGLAASRRYPGLLWPHNDSGNPPMIYATDRLGRSIARVDVLGAPNIDWEDVACGPGHAIWIGDIGNNSLSRNDLAVYRIEEPALDPAASGQILSATATRFPFAYPDGSHNAETLLVDPMTGELFVATKATNGASGVYRFPMPLTPGIPTTLQRIATVTFSSPVSLGRLATGGDISIDRSKLVIRSYLLAYEWPIAAGQSLAQALAEVSKTYTLLYSQGEAICYGPQGLDLYFTAEAIPCPLGMRPSLRIKNRP